MKYHENPRVSALLRLAGSQALRDTSPNGLPDSLTITAALLDVLDDRAWAAVWWSYGAIHHLLDDESLARARDLLRDVRAPRDARASALMLRAEIINTLAIWQETDRDEPLQVRLLEEALAIAPDWPALHIRLAQSHNSLGAAAEAARHGSRALELLSEFSATTDLEPFEEAIAGFGTEPSDARKGLEMAGVFGSTRGGQPQ